MFPAALVQHVLSKEIADSGVRYAWVIDEEYNPDPTVGDRAPARWQPLPGGEVTGPSNATDDELALARAGAPYRLDDADSPALRGRMWASDAAHPRESKAAFAPLDDYGRGAYGCTAILWRDPNGKWVQL